MQSLASTVEARRTAKSREAFGFDEVKAVALDAAMRSTSHVDDRIIVLRIAIALGVHCCCV
jgi:hypothetical protein